MLPWCVLSFMLLCCECVGVCAFSVFVVFFLCVNVWARVWGSVVVVVYAFCCECVAV